MSANMSEMDNNEAAETVEAAEETTRPTPESKASEPGIRAKKLPPQAQVDKFWQSFTTKYPSKVTSILPANVYAKTRAQASTKGLAHGQNAGRSYAEAVAECKVAVEKIVKECRRINAKYRDPHFDIEFDLKRDCRDCLDGLQEISNDDKHWPRSVKRVSDIFENPKFFEDDASASDIRQGFNGDCWFLSALCAISNKKHLIDTVCVARDEAVGVYGFVFHRDGEWIQTIIDDKLYLIASDWWESSGEEKRTIGVVQRDDAEAQYQRLNQMGSKALYFAQCRSENETWLPLLEKAYAKAHGDYSALNGGFTGEAIEDLTGGVTTELFTTDILDKDKFWKNEILKVNHEFLFGCSTGSFDKWQDSDAASQAGARGGIIRLHAYSIMDAVEIKGKRLVKIRNPWATDEWRGPWSDGSEQWTGEWLDLLNHKFGDDGIFWISYEDLLKRYSNFERTRLFDNEWQIVQKWTTVSVPWTADYNDTKFSLTITKRSPVVIVLTQLDSRYFEGLAGQYFFELHFRLSKDGVDEYIVRSHGNYSMRRSVSTDVELDPGTYSVLIRVTAQRDDTCPTPDVVIQENVKFRQNKLIQVGLAYDLAHAKGEIRETASEKRERKELQDQKKVEEKKAQRAEFRKIKLREFERKKREKAREKRQAQRKEEYRRKKAEKQTIAGEATATGADKVTNTIFVNGADIATGDNIEVEKQAKHGGGISKSDQVAADSNNMPTPPAETSKKDENPATDSANLEGSAFEAYNAPLDSTPSYDRVTSTGEDRKDTTASALTEEALKSIPSVTMNGNPVTQSSNAAAPTSVAPGIAASAAGGAAEDDIYDSDASFVSSIDSILDLNQYPSDDDEDQDGGNGDGEGNEEEADSENAPDPWNAVCVVGLRVYSKDEGCSIAVVRPKENSGLDFDDASKGVSGKVEDKRGK